LDLNLINVALNFGLFLIVSLIILLNVRFNLRSGLVSFLFIVALIGLSYNYFIDFLIQSHLISNYPNMFRTGGLAALLSIAFFYLIAHKIYYKRGLRLQILIHLIPVLIYFFNFLDFFLLPTMQKREWIDLLYQQNQIFSFEEGAFLSGIGVWRLRFAQLILVTILSVRISLKIRKATEYPISQRLLVIWISIYLILMLVFSLFFSLAIILDFEPMSIATLFPVICLLSFILVFFFPGIIYKGLNETAFFEDKVATALQQETFWRETTMYQPNLAGLPEESITLTHIEPFPELELSVRQQKILLQIEKQLFEKHAHLEENFSLSTLEDEIGVSSKQISSCIKKAYGKNFIRFINERRIVYVIQQLKEEKPWMSYTNEMLAFKSGFSSPNSFYLAFKELTGKTPRQYIDELAAHEMMRENPNLAASAENEGQSSAVSE
jgi:AraC-like DNA-binding protein